VVKVIFEKLIVTQLSLWNPKDHYHEFSRLFNILLSTNIFTVPCDTCLRYNWNNDDIWVLWNTDFLFSSSNLCKRRNDTKSQFITGTL